MVEPSKTHCLLLRGKKHQVHYIVRKALCLRTTVKFPLSRTKGALSTLCFYKLKTASRVTTPQDIQLAHLCINLGMETPGVNKGISFNKFIRIKIMTSASC